MADEGGEHTPATGDEAKVAINAAAGSGSGIITSAEITKLLL